MTVDLRSRQRSDDGTPESGRLNRRIGEELSTMTSTNKRDDGEKPDGVTVENHGTRLGKKLKVGTWNVRTLDAGKVEIIENEMERIKLNILGICEHRWKGQGHLTTPKGGKFIYSAREQPGHSGVGILLEKETTKSLIGYNPISDRILIVRIQGRKKNMALIQAYAPIGSSEIEEAEEFYTALQHAMENIHKQDTLYILGDFNAKIGHEMSREEKEVKGIHCLGNRNERGQMLVDFCIENRLGIGNSFFKHHPRRLFTWTSPDGKTKNQIDYILVKKRTLDTSDARVNSALKERSGNNSFVGDDKRGKHTPSNKTPEEDLHHLSSDVKEVSLYSDSCPGQNKSSFIAALLSDTLESSNTELKAISHIFLEPVHAYKEVNFMHSAIEAEQKFVPVYTMNNWTNIFRKARKKLPYDVHQFHHNDFLDLQKLGKGKVANLNYDSNGGKIKWASVNSMRFEKSKPGVIQNKYN
ncbi:hypothetical protein RRG08_003138 [Elysia crispata]|uniref:Endonuclease/exonuclease/phosphatase domain-containing protein n=1 Tax=Elysia crispata TaxID=231223 RepID=A0AAE1B786_9GAST|nr:hypothetical protein RRG08_003138 [Elysia crispata]